jgi:hypothetical protein
VRHNFELAYSSGDFHAWLRRRAPKARRYGSVCTGACFLGAAGLLHGLNATTHWQHATEIAERFPAAKVVPDQIYVKDGSLYTGAGVTAGIDLALKLIEDDHGHDLALMVARRLVVFLKRPGGQSQFSAHLAAQIANEGRITGSPAIQCAPCGANCKRGADYGIASAKGSFDGPRKLRRRERRLLAIARDPGTRDRTVGRYRPAPTQETPEPRGNRARTYAKAARPVAGLPL